MNADRFFVSRPPIDKIINHKGKIFSFIAAAGLTFFAFNSANAIILEDNTNDSGVPILDPNLYTGLGNQARFDSVVSFNLNVVTAGDLVGPSRSFASGVLIAPDLVLTAAHVVDDMTSKGTVIAKGMNALSSYQGNSFLTSGSLGPQASSSLQTFNILNWAVDPSWNPSNDSGVDLALVQVASSFGSEPITTYDRNGVTEPINFVPLYSGAAETTQPFPDIGIAVGYGSTGGGLAGQKSGSGGTKRGGLVLIDPTKQVVNGQTVITSHFQDRGQLSSEGLPSNFLEGAPGNGDSGGGLFQTIGPDGSLVQTGVISASTPDDLYSLFNLIGGKINTYGTQAEYTDISSYLPWIEAAALSFGDIVPNSNGTIPTAPDLPFSKTVVAGIETESFFFGVLGGVPVYIDPSGTDLEYAVSSGPNITDILLPDGYSAELMLFNSVTGKFVDSGLVVTGGSWFDLGPEGLSEFELSGLPGADFVTGLEFAASGQVGLEVMGASGDGTFATPEPSTWAMMLVGFVGLGYLGYRRRERLSAL
jgi:hypothetical protein